MANLLVFLTGMGAGAIAGAAIAQRRSLLKTILEARDGLLTPEDYITALYRLILDREPDPEGYRHWLEQLRQTRDPIHVFAGFAWGAQQELRQR